MSSVHITLELLTLSVESHLSALEDQLCEFDVSAFKEEQVMSVWCFIDTKGAELSV